mmetsp:Transcript_5691/g.22326  ORF Transcript_5691/g.22326 Transcript_5691/m.22326 type:complete len:116 (-) Transcript_5691:185-532(-)|eukprot:scaffold803_cov310-Pinguiococcus_pyrenoidosus.AAC.125
MGTEEKKDGKDEDEEDFVEPLRQVQPVQRQPTTTPVRKTEKPSRRGTRPDTSERRRRQKESSIGMTVKCGLARLGTSGRLLRTINAVLPKVQLMAFRGTYKLERSDPRKFSISYF